MSRVSIMALIGCLLTMVGCKSFQADGVIDIERPLILKDLQGEERQLEPTAEPLVSTVVLAPASEQASLRVGGDNRQSITFPFRIPTGKQKILSETGSVVVTAREAGQAYDLHLNYREHESSGSWRNGTRPCFYKPTPTARCAKRKKRPAACRLRKKRGTKSIVFRERRTLKELTASLGTADAYVASGGFSQSVATQEIKHTGLCR